MRRARGTDGARLIQSSEFLATTQITPFFSRQSALVRQRDPDEADIRAAQEESNFSEAKETVVSIQLDHPLIYGQYDLCEMALNDSLKILKLPMLQYMCASIFHQSPCVKSPLTWLYWKRLSANVLAKSHRDADFLFSLAE